MSIMIPPGSRYAVWKKHERPYQRSNITAKIRCLLSSCDYSKLKDCVSLNAEDHAIACKIRRGWQHSSRRPGGHPRDPTPPSLPASKNDIRAGGRGLVANCCSSASIPCRGRMPRRLKLMSCRNASIAGREAYAGNEGRGMQ